MSKFAVSQSALGTEHRPAGDVLSLLTREFFKFAVSQSALCTEHRPAGDVLSLLTREFC